MPPPTPALPTAPARMTPESAYARPRSAFLARAHATSRPQTCRQSCRANSGYDAMIAPQADPLDKTSLVGLAAGSRLSGLRSPAHVALNGVFMSDGVAKAFLITTQSPVGVWVQQWANRWLARRRGDPRTRRVGGAEREADGAPSWWKMMRSLRKTCDRSTRFFREALAWRPPGRPYFVVAWGLIAGTVWLATRAGRRWSASCLSVWPGGFLAAWTRGRAGLCRRVFVPRRLSLAAGP